MAPGCGSNLFFKQQSSLDTVDSFEVLEQTVMKQKRLAKKKKCDLRMKILLKRTFDLVCDIMDRENGFENDDDYDGSDRFEADNKFDERKLEECLENSINIDEIDSSAGEHSSSYSSNSSSNSSNLTVTNNNLNATNYSHYSCYDDNQLVPSLIACIPLPPLDDEESDQDNTHKQEEQQQQQQQVEKDDKCLKLDVKSLKRKFEMNINNNPNKKLKLVDQNVTNKNKKKVNKHHKSKSNNKKTCSIISVR